ncbi:MAG TPA: hypothetical protein VIY52_13850 [Streptosporangiaceae bacterium]
MVDLTSELQQVADDAARQARPLAVAEVIRRGDRRRRRSITRLSLGGLSATGVVAAVIVGVIALLPASHQPSPPVHAQLAAWTVVKQADGTVLVKIREFRDPAGLQRELRADGIPASVQFNPANLVGKGPWAIVHFKGNPCQEYSGGEGQAQNVVTGGSPFTVGMFVHPSAIPSGAGVQFVVSSNVGYDSPQRNEAFDLFEWLVQPSPQCTGS